MTKAIDFGTNALGTIIKGALVDKPNLSIAPQNVGPISFPYGCAMEGMTYAEPQDAFMGRAYMPRSIQSNQDDTDLVKLCSRPGYFGRFVVDALQARGDIVFLASLSPTAEVQNLAFAQTFQPSLMAYCALPATLWSCSAMRYTIVASMSGMHSVRIAITSNYGSFIPPPLQDENFGQFVTVHDFTSDACSVTVDVPWKCTTPALRVQKGFVENESAYSYGSIYLRLLTELQAPESVSPVVDFCVYVSMVEPVFTNYGTGISDYSPILPF